LEFRRIGGIIGGVRFWVLLAAVIGYHVQDVWDYLLIWKHYHPEYPGMVVKAILSPGWLFFPSRLLIGLTNAIVYGAIVYVVLFSAAQFRRLRVKTSN